MYNKIKKLLLFVITTTALVQQCHTQALLQQVAAWRLLSFGELDPRNTIATGVSVTRDRIFVSMPRARDNTPVTLAWTPKINYNQGFHNDLDSPLIPFPDWSWQSGHLDNCTGLVSVFRTRVDKCGRLWVLDSGHVNTSTRVCPARMFVFDPNNGIPLRVMTIPDQLLRQTSVFPFFEFEHETSASCDAMHVYIADTLGYGLIVLNAATGLFWRFDHETFRNDPQFARFMVAGESATTEDGILGMAVAPLNGENMLFYRPFSSLSIYAIPTVALKYPQSNIQLPVLHVWNQPSQGVAMAAHGNRLLFSPLTETTLQYLDTSTLYINDIATEPILLQFIPDIFVDKNGDIWLISNRFQRFSASSYNPNEINFRIIRIRGKSAFLSSFSPNLGFWGLFKK